MSCPSADRLRAYALGDLERHEVEAIGGHLETCPACESTIESFDTPPDPLLAALVVPAQADPYANEPELAAALRSFKERPYDFPPTEPGGTIAAGVPEREGETGERRSIRDYELLRELGEGGMGTVFLARHRRLKREVALKVIATHRTRDPHALIRFEREMEAIGKLDHVNIVRALDAGEQDGTHYLVMEYVAGETFSDLLRRHGTLPVADACELVRQAAEGLQYAYERGFVHRDIKPRNLMLSQDGVVKVVDLGLARFLNTDKNDLTADGQVVGTRNYMAPEQARDSRQADIRADIYSLGCTLFRLLVGRLPAGLGERPTDQTPAGDRPEVARTLQDARPDVPAELAHYVASIMAVLPDDRPATPRDVADILARFARGASLTSLVSDRADHRQTQPSPQAEDRTAANCSRLRRGWYVAISCLLLLAIAAAWYALGPWPKRAVSTAGPLGPVIARSTTTEVEQQRRAARRILELGGLLVLHGNPREIRSEDELPRFGEVRVQKIELLDIQISPGEVRSLLQPLGRDLQFLRLAGLEELPDETIQLIASFRRLKALYLEQTPLTDDQLTKLQTLTKLTSLRVDTTPLTDRSIPALSSFTQLESLGLRATRITPAGIKQLQAALPKCEIKFSGP